MRAVSRPARAVRLFCVGVLIAGCAGPMPTENLEQSPSPAPTGTAVASPTLEPSQTTGADQASTPEPPPPSTSAPIITPTYEPEPTPESAVPRRTTVEINPTVVERPGVPPELHDRYWWDAFGDAGQLGTTAQIGLPENEQIIEVVDGRVVASRHRPNKGDALIVRDFLTGSVIRSISTDMPYPDAVLVGNELFWAGADLAVDSPPSRDLGVWASDVSTDEPPISIVPPGKALPGVFCTRALEISPSRRTLAARASCYDDNGWIDVIDVETRQRIRRIQDRDVRAITDDTYLSWDGTLTDGLTVGQGGVTAYDLAKDAARWRFPDAADVARFALYNVAAFGNAFVVESFWDLGNSGEFRTTIFNPTTGQHRLLLHEPDGADEALIFDRRSSTRSYLVFDRGWSLDIAITGTPISVLRVSDGVLLRDAFVIDPPFICSNDYCFRD
jgi:hypothetical protein